MRTLNIRSVLQNSEDDVTVDRKFFKLMERGVDWIYSPHQFPLPFLSQKGSRVF